MKRFDDPVGCGASSRRYTPTEAGSDLFAVVLKSLDQGLDPDEALIRVVVRLPNLAILARMDDVQ